MSRKGVTRIFLYNWPTYAVTWSGAALLLAVAGHVPPWSRDFVLLGAAIALVWSMASLLVSYYVYDASRLVRAEWLPGVLGVAPRTWAMIHAGLDQELELDTVMPGQRVARLDIFDPRVMTAPSIERARALTPSSSVAIRCTPDRLALPDCSCDAVVIAFSAHEIRDRLARESFFREIHRVLRPGGSALLVEHLRDAANFLAFGPGFLHFVSRGEWLRLAALANLGVSSELRITPFVMALTLGRAA
jgi:hypothetical protein